MRPSSALRPFPSFCNEGKTEARSVSVSRPDSAAGFVAGGFERIHDVALLGLAQFRINGQGQRFAGGRLGLRKITLSIAERGKALLEVQRPWI